MKFAQMCSLGFNEDMKKAVIRFTNTELLYVSSNSV